MARSLSLALPPLVLASFFALPAQATVIVPLTIEDMAVQSACVVRGRVVESVASWDKDHQRIYTHTTVEVLDPIHTPSRLPQKITVKTIGGEVGKIGMRVSGVEKFAPNEEVVLFLRRDPIDQQLFQTVGMSQGKFSIEHEAKGRAVAVPSIEGLAFARPDANGTLKVDGHSPSPNRIPLTELKERIQAALTAQVKTPATADPLKTPPVADPAQPATPNVSR
jgi:hypothetical protein